MKISVADFSAPIGASVFKVCVMEKFDTLPIQCRHIEHKHEGVYNFCLHRFYMGGGEDLICIAY